MSSSLNFQNSNLFHGGEQLHLQLRGGYESLGERRNDHLNYGAEASLTFPPSARALPAFEGAINDPVLDELTGEL